MATLLMGLGVLSLTVFFGALEPLVFSVPALLAVPVMLRVSRWLATF